MSNWRDRYYEDGYLRRWGLEPGGQLEAQKAEAYLKLTGAPARAVILDLGCGHGRYAIPLASMGYNVCGLDGSWPLLRRAQVDATRVRERVSWVRGDMRALPFRDAFDVALILDAFGYFDAAGEDLRFLSGLRDVLRPDGRFVMRNPNGALIRRQFRPADEEVRDGATTSVRSDLSRDGWWLHQDVTIQQLGSTHSYVRHQRIYAAEELDELMRATRFSVLGHYADASGMPFDSLISTHLVTVCAKR